MKSKTAVIDIMELTIELYAHFIGIQSSVQMLLLFTAVLNVELM